MDVSHASHTFHRPATGTASPRAHSHTDSSGGEAISGGDGAVALVAEQQVNALPHDSISVGGGDHDLELAPSRDVAAAPLTTHVVEEASSRLTASFEPIQPILSVPMIHDCAFAADAPTSEQPGLATPPSGTQPRPSTLVHRPFDNAASASVTVKCEPDLEPSADLFGLVATASHEVATAQAAGDAAVQSGITEGAASATTMQVKAEPADAQQHLATPATSARVGRKRANPLTSASNAVASSIAVRRSKRLKQEVDYSQAALSAAAAASAAEPMAPGFHASTQAPSRAAAGPMRDTLVDGDPETAALPLEDCHSPVKGGKGKAKATTPAKGKGKAPAKFEGACDDEPEPEEPKVGRGGKGAAKGKAKGKDDDASGPSKPKAKRAPRKPKPVNSYKEEIENDPKLANMPIQIKDRIIRVLSQRMFLINRYRAPGSLREEFDILGSVGSVYKVTVGPKPYCTCIDHRIRKALCKHLIFVYLKVLRLPRHSPILLETKLSDRQLSELFDAARPNPVEEGAQASTAVRKAWANSIGLRIADEDSDKGEDLRGKRILAEAGDACAVCYEDLPTGTSNGLTFCTSSCGRPLHDECFEEWCTAKGGLASGRVTCVWCRAPYLAPSSTDGLQENGYGVGLYRGVVRPAGAQTGILNLADVAGVSKVRDTSTYRRNPPSGKTKSSDD